VYTKGDDCWDEYVEVLNNLLELDAKKYNSKKRWSRGVVEMLLPMHIGYTSEFGTGQQTAGWLSDKAMAHKMKFETDQRNQIEELTKKRKAGEEEHLETQKIAMLLQKHLHSWWRPFNSSLHRLLRLRT
jgi:hypothetical protein